jgi:uncharacterized protein (TIGR02246 family)
MIILGSLLIAALSAGRQDVRTDSERIEQAVLATSAEMTRSGEAADIDGLFRHMLETDKGSVIQNGIFLATREDALQRVKSNMRGIGKIRYTWKRQHVTVLSPEAALLTAEGQSVATTAAGETISTPFAQSIVFVLRDGQWKAIHAHQSSPQVR